ncbi:MAG: C_GCAxxG_C_C family protein [Oscillospiraceae bacterium]|nr:C_GCAxxG_C_C family protein [Oscillospiraceae bacterium]
MNKLEYAVKMKHSGYNCCQAVLLAYVEELGLTEECLTKLGAGFGSGMGTMEGTCGALCGAEMILGLYGYEGRRMNPQAGNMQNSFKEKCGATICKDLKGVETGKMLCSCDDCVRNAVRLVEEQVMKN